MDLSLLARQAPWLLNSLLLLLAIQIICFGYVIVTMFRREQSTLAVVTIVTTFCPGIGPFIALTAGWLKVTAWQLRTVMLVWSAALVVGAILTVVAAFAVRPGETPKASPVVTSARSVNNYSEFAG